MKKASLLLCSVICICNFAFAQYQSTFNLFSFTHQKKYSSNEFAKKTPEQFKSHPDYEVLPHNAPCEDCMEELDKRTANTRNYLKKDGKGTLTYLQQSFLDFNYKDENGWLRELNANLSPDANHPKVFSAMKQPAPVVVNMEEKYSSVTSGKKEFRFNKNLQLYHLGENGKETSLGKPNWDNFTAGDEGVSIKDFYPGIDVEMIVHRGEVETNFILNHPLPFTGGYLVMKEDVDMPEGLSFDISNTTLNAAGERTGKINVSNANENIFFEIENGIAYDASSENNQSAYVNLTSVIENSTMKFFVPMNFLNDSKTVYPVVTNFLMQAADTDSTRGSLPQASIIGSGYTATCPPAVVGPGCTYVLNMLSPPYSTIIDILYSFDYRAIAPNHLQQGGFSIGYLGCSSPAVGANTCPIPVPGVCARHRQTIFAEVSSCLPAPSCPSYPMDFTLHFYRCVGALVGCTNTEIIAQTNWTMTVVGRLLELDFVCPDANVCLGGCTDLTASGSYGVAPYTFHWTPGGDSAVGNMNPVNVCPLVTTQYTCTMTDACTYNAPPWESNLMDDSSFVTVNIGPPTNPGFTFSPPNPCVGNVVTVTGLGTGAATDYNWDIVCTGQTFNAQRSFTITFSTSVPCDITLNYGSVPCINSLTQTINVSPIINPSVIVSSNPPFPICAGSCVTLIAFPTNGGTNPAYQWQLNGVTIAGSTNSTYTTCNLTDGDFVNVIMTSNAPCAAPLTATAGVASSFYPLVLPVIIQSGDTLTTQQSFTNYQWYLNSVAISGATNYLYVATQSGNYNVIATDTNGCLNQSGPEAVIAGIEENDFAKAFEIYPNPAHVELYVTSYKLYDGEINLEIYNSIGEKIYEQQITTSNLKLQTSNLSAGIYLLKISSDDRMMTKKIVVEK